MSKVYRVKIWETNVRTIEIKAESRDAARELEGEIISDDCTPMNQRLSL